MYRMPNGRQKAAVYPDKTLGKYDLEYTANQLISLVALARDPDIEGMLAYKPRHGQWHSVDPNPSQETSDFLLLLDECDRRTKHLERVQQAIRSRLWMGRRRSSNGTRKPTPVGCASTIIWSWRKPTKQQITSCKA